jgi:SAM-dependent methyltransferase
MKFFSGVLGAKAKSDTLLNHDGSSPEVLHHYDENHSTRSAAVVVPYICDLLHPQSVVDVGCGVGQWLKVFEDHGVFDVLGLDGPHVPVESRLISPVQFAECDLSQPRPLERRFDLAISLEVAEHLEPQFAPAFVEFLTTISDRIIFSAAIPFQTGENHHNEQPPEYWEELFAKHGFVFLDAFRQKFWHDKRINWWYRQNMYLVVPQSYANSMNFRQGVFHAVHPEMLAMYTGKAERG